MKARSSSRPCRSRSPPRRRHISSCSSCSAPRACDAARTSICVGNHGAPVARRAGADGPPSADDRQHAPSSSNKSRSDGDVKRMNDERCGNAQDRIRNHVRDRVVVLRHGDIRAQRSDERCEQVRPHRFKSVAREQSSCAWLAESLARSIDALAGQTSFRTGRRTASRGS